MLPELWLDEVNCRVYQKNMVTTVTYQFMSPEDARKGQNIIDKEMVKCFKGRNKRPFYPDYAIEACLKAGIAVQVW